MTRIKYELRRSKRKTIALSISGDLSIIVRAPFAMPLYDIESFIQKHNFWIIKHKMLMEQRLKEQLEIRLTDIERDELKCKAQDFLPQRIAKFSVLMGVVPTSIKITSAKTRWGSCSAKNNICFSYRIMLLPNEVIDYIIVHELVHIKVKNHSAKFYAEIAKYLPDYKVRIAKLKQIQNELPI